MGYDSRKRGVGVVSMAIKKQWYEIVAPEMFGGKVIGETPSVDPRYLENRVIDITITELLGDYSRFFMKVRLQVERVDGTKAYTRFVGHSCLTERIYRMVQRRTRRVDSIVDVTTEDKRKIRLKMVLVLARRVKTSVKDVVRAKMRQLMLEKTEKMQFEELVKDIIDGKFQAYVRDECRKIYPVSGIEIRRSEVMDKIADEKNRKVSKEKAESE